MQSGRVKRYAQSLDQRSKTDALDSRMLSMLGLERTLRLWHPPSLVLQELKALSRERSSLLKDKTVETNRHGALLSSVNENAKASKRHKARLKLLNSQIASIEQEMRALISEDQALKRKLCFLESIPGISFVSAATVIGETLGFESIASGKQLASYAGYDVVLRESGNFKGKTRISKKGNSYIRAALHMPSMTCVRCNPTLKTFYNRLKPNKAKPLVALVAVQRKLLILMFTLWQNEENYDPEFENKKQQKHEALAAQDNNLINQFVS
jgi:transposase